MSVLTDDIVDKLRLVFPQGATADSIRRVLSEDVNPVELHNALEHLKKENVICHLDWYRLVTK